MIVYDLCCEAQHRFEGWFGSEADYQSQLARALIACPICNSSRIEKRPSAPRLNLSGARAPEGADAHAHGDLPATEHGNNTPAAAMLTPAQRQAAMLELARQVLKHTEDVGEQFADEARRIHYKEAPERPIRGVATQDEQAELHDEGIDVFPLAIPAALKETLQ